jgi:C_GCAxxG_C_C family probable redox protein
MIDKNGERTRPMQNPEKDEFLAAIEKRAFDYEANHHDCAQCTLLTLQEAFGLPEPNAFKAATGFAGGMGRTGHVCGGLTGAFMMFGLLWGRDMEVMMLPDKTERLERLEEIEQKLEPLIKELQARFRREYGGITCNDIQTKLFGKPYSTGTPEEREEMERLGGHVDKCPGVVGKAARWAAELILEEKG